MRLPEILFFAALVACAKNEPKDPPPPASPPAASAAGAAASTATADGCSPAPCTSPASFKVRDHVSVIAEYVSWNRARSGTTKLDHGANLVLYASF